MGTDVQDLTARAKKLFSERRYQESVRVCRRVLLSRPGEIPVRLLLGMALLVLRRYDEVRVEMMAVIRRDASQGPAHRLLGEAYLRSGQSDKAQEALRRAAELDPEDQATRELMAEVEEESAPVSETIERWFNPELVGTVQTDLPDLEGESTVVQPGRSEDAGRGSAGPQVGAGPLAPESTTAARPAASRALESAPTLAVPPVSRQEQPAGGARSPSASERGPGTDMLDVEDIEPLDDPLSREGPEDALDAEPTIARSQVPAPSFPGPGRGPAPSARSSGHPADPASAAAAEWARFPPSGPPAGQSPLDEEPTRARPELDELDAEPTRARPVLDELDEERTRARPPMTPLPAPPGWEEASPAPVGPRPASEPAPPRPRPFAPPSPQAGPPSPASGPRPGFAAPPPVAAPSAPSPAPPEPTPPLLQPGVSGPPTADSTERMAPQGGRPGWVRQQLEPLLARTRPLLQRARRRFPKWPTPLLVAAGVLPLAAVVGIAVGLFVALDRRGDRDIEVAVRKATADGLESSLAQAIHLDQEVGAEDPKDLARRARLYAMAILEHGVDYGEAARKILGRLQGEEAALPDARVAQAYLALASGDVERARSAVAPVRGEGDTAVEASRARALAAVAGGDLQGAVVHATAAVSERPGTPRHVALAAWLTARHAGPDGVKEALDALDAVPQGEESPAVRLARARILQIAGADRDRVAGEARAVIQELGKAATAYQHAGAHLVLARRAAEVGDASTARTHAREAAKRGPPYDEDFGLSVASVLLRVGEATLAGAVLDRLPTPSLRSDERALLRAEVALAAGDAEAAEQALEDVQDSPRTAYVRGRVAELRGNVGTARRHFERAAADPELLLQARLRLATIALDGGEPGQAVDLLKSVRSRGPADPELIPLLARALLADGEDSQADEVVAEALEQRPESPPLIVAKARVEMAKGETNRALRRLRELSSKRPRDVELHAMWALFAARTGRSSEARDAIERALELEEGHPKAQLARAELALAEQKGEAAKTALEAARTAGADPDALARLQGRLMVLEGRGREAAEALAQIPAGARESAEWSALGRAYAQAEDRRAAERAFQQTLRRNPHDVEAHLGLSLLSVRAGRLSVASAQVRKAEKAAKRSEPGDIVESRILAAQGRIKFEHNLDQAHDLAEKALAKDSRNAEAHLLLAHIADARGNGWKEHLQRAVEGRAPLPEALALLALELGASDEGCALAKRYLQAAPRGYDARDVRKLRGRCR